jgi:hypothetical protein
MGFLVNNSQRNCDPIEYESILADGTTLGSEQRCAYHAIVPPDKSATLEAGSLKQRSLKQRFPISPRRRQPLNSATKEGFHEP